MFFVRRPTQVTIDAFLDQDKHSRLSYDAPDILSRPPAGYQLDEQIVTIGHGRRTFDRARQALMEWEHYDFNWVQLFPRRPSLQPGTGFAVLIRHLGFFSLNGGRVLTRADAADDDISFAFTYGTLTSHAESGEEMFEVAAQGAAAARA